MAVAMVLPPVASDARADTCPPACEEHGVCDGGKCWCEKGWVGDDCAEEGENPCEMACFGRGRCKPATGTCDCETGWRGPFCGKKKGKGGEKGSGKRAVRPPRDRVADSADSAAPAAGEGSAYCPPQWAAMEWWERYKPAGHGTPEEVVARLKACEQRPDPGVCVDTLVKLGEVRRPPFPGCEYRRPQP